MKYTQRFTNKKEFKDLYESTAYKYDANRSGSFEGKRVNFLQKKFILSKIKQYCSSERKKYSDLSILEAGCGTGRILIPLARTKLNCSGLDTSKNMLKIIGYKAKKENIRITLKKGDIEKIPFPPNSFDIVYTLHVLMHMSDYKKSIKEMYRVVKKKGIVIADFPNKDSIWTKLSVLANPKKKRTRLFTIKELSKFFKNYDYQITGLFSYARTFYRIPILKHINYFLERFIKLPVRFRTQLLVIIKK